MLRLSSRSAVDWPAAAACLIAAFRSAIFCTSSFTEPTAEAISWSALDRNFWMPLEVSRNCDVTLSSASTTLDCSAELVGVLASDDNADSSDASVLASEVPVEVLVALVEDP